MIVIADSGSTKTTWSLWSKDRNKLTILHTAGINPFYQDSQEIMDMLSRELPDIAEQAESIYFYGAGCSGASGTKIVYNALRRHFDSDQIEVESDLMAAARALCRHTEGIACILGTGSNSCYYNGLSIERQVPPLGFILGDEGSGAVMGRKLLGDILKSQLSDRLIRAFYDTYRTTPDEIMDNIYRKPFPNRYAAQFAVFLRDNTGEEEIRNLVFNEFKSFFIRNVRQYDNAGHLPVHFTGSIAWHFSDILKETAGFLNYHIGKVVKAPMENLLEYHGAGSRTGG